MERIARLPFVITIAVFLVSALAVPGHAATRSAASCSRTDVGNAVSASTYGDTVQVPAGTCTWSSTLTITRGITLAGAGALQTTIVSGLSSGRLIVYQPDSTSVSTNAKFELSGMTFDMNNTATGALWIDNESPTTSITKVLIHDNVFKNSTAGENTLTFGYRGDSWGVVYKNRFENCKLATRIAGDNDASWNNTRFAYGTADNLYFEDNVYVGNSVFHYGEQGGRYVSRFETFDFQPGGWEVVWDAHGNQAGGLYSTMGCEIYGNTVTLEGGTSVIDHRGGPCMFFQNTTTGSTGSWQVREEYDDSLCPTTNPTPQHVSDSYYFLNTFNGNNQLLTETQDCCNAIAENQQFWNYTPSFNGTVGVGAGPVAARPSTCTTGVGYWATDEGEWNSLHSGPDGQLYKCTSTNTWTLYYRPYPYPHPLRQLQPAPQPPQNVIIR